MSGGRVHPESVFVSHEKGPWRFNMWVVKKLAEAE